MLSHVLIPIKLLVVSPLMPSSEGVMPQFVTFGIKVA